MDIPLRIMFDAVRAEALSTPGVKPRTPEEKKIVKVLAHLRHQIAGGHDVRAMPYSQPDIWCSIPDRVVQRPYPEFPGWAAVIEAVDPNRSFKRQVLQACGLEKVKEDDFLAECLKQWSHVSEPPSAELQGAMAALFNEYGSTPPM